MNRIRLANGLSRRVHHDEEDFLPRSPRFSPVKWPANREREFVDHSRPSSRDRASPIGGSRATRGSTSGHQSDWFRPREKSLSLEPLWPEIVPLPFSLLFLSFYLVRSRARKINSRCVNYHNIGTPIWCLFFFRTEGSVESRYRLPIARIVAVSRKTVASTIASSAWRLDPSIVQRFILVS